MEEQIENPEEMETIVSGPSDQIPDDDFASLDDELDSLREKSTRTSDVYDVLEEEKSGGLSATISGFSPSQRLILALLIFIDVVACACALLVVTRVI